MCDCINTTNALLAQHNTRITLSMFGDPIPFVLTQKVDEKRRGKAVLLRASYCPFCGEKYVPAEKAEGGAA